MLVIRVLPELTGTYFPPIRMAIVDGAGQCHLRDEGIENKWWRLDAKDPCHDIVVSGARVGVIAGTEPDRYVCYVAEGAQPEAVTLDERLELPARSADGNPESCTQLALDGDRIGIVGGDGNCYVIDGDAGDRPVRVPQENCTAIAVSGSRVGVVAGESCFVTQGRVDDGGSWVKVLGSTAGDGYSGAVRDSCRAISLARDRIGLRAGDSPTSTCYVLEGGLHAELQPVFGPLVQSADPLAAHGACLQIVLSGLRVAVADDSVPGKATGYCFAKDGALSETWLSERGDCEGIALAGSRIGTANVDGTCSVKEGDASEHWIEQLGDGSQGCREIAMTGRPEPRFTLLRPERHP